jgi:hypothetical protein
MVVWRMRRGLAIAIGAVVIAAFTIVLLANGRDNPRLSAGDSPSAPDDVVDQSDSSWVKELTEGSRIEFVHPGADVSDPGAGVVATIQSLGPLPDDQVARLVRSIGVVRSAKALAEATTRAESGVARDFVDFLKERCAYEKVLAAERMAKEGNYVTLEMSESPPVPPEGFVLLGQFGVGNIDGKRVTAWFMIDLELSENRAVAVAQAQWEDAESSIADESVLAFNNQELSMRQAKIRKHDEAESQLQGSEPLTTAVTAELRKQIIPGIYRIHRDVSRISKRGLRRY